jgi:glyoxylase-like metal-dependent hydrolase (beta-lactamase superfamily II)
VGGGGNALQRRVLGDSMARRKARPKARPRSECSVDVLFEGYVTPGVAGTVSLVRDGSHRIIIDPGMVPRRESILRPLGKAGIAAEQVTDVIFSHHHPDHTLNAALFPRARVHDFWAIYRNDVWQSRPAEGFHVSRHVQLIETPGHTPQDITTLVTTSEGVYAFTHLWWDPSGPAEDPLAQSPALLHKNRARVVRLSQWIVPGHGSVFRPSDSTPI